MKAIITVLLFFATFAGAAVGKAGWGVCQIPDGNGDSSFIHSGADSLSIYALPQSFPSASADKLRERRSKLREKLDCFDSACAPQYAVREIVNLFYLAVVSENDRRFCPFPKTSFRNSGGHSHTICNLLI